VFARYATERLRTVLVTCSQGRWGDGAERRRPEPDNTNFLRPNLATFTELLGVDTFVSDMTGDMTTRENDLFAGLR
jgi:hypothetical protein